MTDKSLDLIIEQLKQLQLLYGPQGVMTFMLCLLGCAGLILLACNWLMSHKIKILRTEIDGKFNEMSIQLSNTQQALEKLTNSLDHLSDTLLDIARTTVSPDDVHHIACSDIQHHTEHCPHHMNK